MSFKQINKLMNFLSLGEVTGEPTEVKGGLLHKMFRVYTSSGSYAVKVLNSEIMKCPTRQSMDRAIRKITEEVVGT